MCGKLAKVRALSNDIICDWMHVCLYSWLCALLGMCDDCVPSWEWVLIFMIVCPVGDMCLCFDAKLVMCIHMICDKYMICLLMCMSRRTTRGEDWCHLFILICDHMICEKYMICWWMCMSRRTTRGVSEPPVGNENCSYDLWWVYELNFELCLYILWLYKLLHLHVCVMHIIVACR